MLATQILCTFYTGIMSSHVISPSLEETLSNLVALDRHNYSMIGEGTPGWINILKSTPYVLKGKVSVLRSIYENNPLRQLNRSEIVQELAEKNKVAVLRLWPYALGSANQMNDLIASGKISPYQKKKCYVDEELIPTQEVFFALTQPGSQSMGWAHRRLISSGIMFRWLKENMWLASSPRVQDRARIPSPTKILHPLESIDSLRMDGRVVTIFMLWIACLAVCLLGFMLEVFGDLLVTN